MHQRYYEIYKIIEDNYLNIKNINLCAHLNEYNKQDFCEIITIYFYLQFVLNNPQINIADYC